MILFAKQKPLAREGLLECGKIDDEITLVTYSRLVFCCNRARADPGERAAIVGASECNCRAFQWRRHGASSIFKCRCNYAGGGCAADIDFSNVLAYVTDVALSQATLAKSGASTILIYKLYDRRFQAIGNGLGLRKLRSGDVILILRNSNGCQDRDDRNDDHQFNQGEALLDILHGGSSMFLVS